MDSGQGDKQRAIIVALGSGPKSVREIAVTLYGADLPKTNDSARRALRRLAQRGIVKKADVFTREDGSQCWKLADVEIRSPPERQLRPVR